MKRESLAHAGAAALAMLIAVTQAPPIHSQGEPAARSTPKFETASVKPASRCGEGDGMPRLGISASPRRLSIKCQTVDFLIRQAYLANGRDPLFVSTMLYSQPIQGSPAWINSERYAIDAKAEPPEGRETMLGPMLQALLEDRFKLKIHRQTRDVAVYELTAGKGGPKLQAATERGCVPFEPDKLNPPRGTHACGVLVRSLNPAVPTALYGATTADLSRELSRLLNREVVDKTGIPGLFDIRLELSRADLFPLSRSVSSDPTAPASASEPSGSSIFRALQTLGLKLESGRGRGEFLVIDRVQRPSAN